MRLIPSKFNRLFVLTLEKVQYIIISVVLFTILSKFISIIKRLEGQAPQKYNIK